MDKRLIRTELLFTLGFLFLLVTAVAAFFLGMKIGKERTEARYAPKAEAASVLPVTAYQQQDLVSYYHTVYQPFRSFIHDWIREAGRMKAGQTSEPAARLKELSASAKQRYAEAEQADMPAVSPLLVDAQTNVLRSLKLFEQSFSQHAASKNTDAREMIREIGSDAYYRQALEHALLAERQYFDAMVQWSASLDPDIPEDVPDRLNMTTEAWRGQPLVLKNAMMAAELLDRLLLTDYYPHDLTARVDQFIASGQASAMGAATVEAAVDLLIRTDAVRNGDFRENRAFYDAEELLPQLPFFLAE